MVIEFILCMLKDLSIQLGLQIWLFVVFNIIIIIFLGGPMSRIRKFAFKSSFHVCVKCCIVCSLGY